MTTGKKDFLKAGVLSLPRYNSGLAETAVRERYSLEHITRLASNENPFGVSTLAEQAAREALSDLWKYSDPDSTELRLALSRQTGIAAAKIVIGNGSEDLIAVICRACLDKGDRVVTVHPSFLLHEIYPAEQGAHVITIPMSADFEFNIDGLISELNRGCKMLIFSNPSNPVGTMIDSEGFSRICQAASPDTILVVDEAYYEYAATQEQFPDSLALLRQRNHPYAVLRTFSKAYGLAGLRVGYGYFSDTRFADHINKLRTPFNVNSLAQTAARAALEDKEHLVNTIQYNSRERSRVSTQLRRHGYRVAESHANFIFLDTGHNSLPIAERLLAQGIIVKPWTAKGYENFLRVTIGKAEDNNLFLKWFIRHISIPDSANDKAGA